MLAQAVISDEAGLDARTRQTDELTLQVRLLPSGAGAWLRGVRHGDFSGAIEALAPLAGDKERIGGSRAQHDLIEFTLLRAYINADRLEEARRLLGARRPGAAGVPVLGVAAVH
jgi:hypothetical protein